MPPPWRLKLTGRRRRLGTGLPSSLAGVKWAVAAAAVAAASISLKPLEVMMRTSVAWPRTSTSISSRTVPSSPRLRHPVGYRGRKVEGGAGGVWICAVSRAGAGAGVDDGRDSATGRSATGIGSPLGSIWTSGGASRCCIGICFGSSCGGDGTSTGGARGDVRGSAGGVGRDSVARTSSDS